MSVLIKRVSSWGLLLLCLIFNHHAASSTTASADDWLSASQLGHYDTAVRAATAAPDANSALAILLALADERQLAHSAQWRALLHYKPTLTQNWLSQVDAPHFFLSEQGKQSPEAELQATLAALFSLEPKAPLRLTAYCRFVARRQWLEHQLGEQAQLIPVQSCPEFDRYKRYLDADVLTLIFPTAHPNSPSSAFGHTLLRIDKKDQRSESRLLNMSINFAAEIPEGVSAFSYTVGGLAGGFPGRYRLLPYHMKLREYGQIENRDTWEYELNLTKPQVDRVLSHAYEMLISDFDYFFFSENCSYHLLSLLDVVFPDEPLTDAFNLWTIPIDTIRQLEKRNLVAQKRFVPSSIRTLRARKTQLSEADNALTLRALNKDLPAIDASLMQLPPERQAGILDLLSDYERYNRLKTDPSAQGSSSREKAVLSRRSKVAVKTSALDITTPQHAPDSGHGTTRLSLNYHYREDASDTVELQFRPAYHDFRDPSAAYGGKAAIEMGLVGIAMDTTSNDAFLRRFTLLSIESIEPRGSFFQPVSWHTNLKWERPHSQARHEALLNVGGGLAFSRGEHSPVAFVFAEADLVDAPAFSQRRQLRPGISAGIHWEPVSGFRSGLEFDVRRQLGGDYHETHAELWAGFALNSQWSINVDAAWVKSSELPDSVRASAGLRFYF